MKKKNKQKYKRKSGKADTQTYTYILSIITVLQICLSLRAVETRVYILEQF